MISSVFIIGVTLLTASILCHIPRDQTTAAATTEFTEYACLIDEDCQLFSESMFCDSKKKVCRYQIHMFSFASLTCVNVGCPEGAECDHQTQSCRQRAEDI